LFNLILTPTHPRPQKSAIRNRQSEIPNPQFLLVPPDPQTPPTPSRPKLTSFTVRLSVGCALLFIASAAVLFGLLYFLMSSALEQKDHEIIEARLKECAAVYQSGGLNALRNLVQNNNPNPNVDPDPAHSFLVSVTGNLGSVLLLSVPHDWLQFDTKSIQTNEHSQRPVWLRIPKDAEKDITVASMQMFDGSLLQVGRSTNNHEAFLQPFRRTFLLVMTPTLLIGVLGGAWFAHRATQPVRETVATSRRIIDTGDFSQRVPATTPGAEFEDLAHELNRLLDKNQTLIQGMRDALDNVAHDLRTPLTRLRASAESALQTTTDPAAQEALADSVEESDRVLTILTTLMDITEAESGVMKLKLEKTSIAAMLRKVVSLYDLITEEKKIKVTTDFTEPCDAMVDAPRLQQAFANLLDNALKYTPEGGSVHLSCAPTPSAHVTVNIQDTGIGIPLDEQPRIWERLYRGDKSRTQRGLGLGLSLVKAIITAHHGSVTVQSVPGAGSTFTVTRPSAAT
jgi:signal transduction histidine kinase